MNFQLKFWVLAIMLAVSACHESDPADPRHAKRDATTQAQEHGAEQGQDAHHGDAQAQVALSPEQIRIAGIEVLPMRPASIHETLPIYGIVVANAERVREVSARFPGVIRSIEKKIGDSVKRGDILATVESNESLRVYAVSAPQAGVISARNANTGEQTGERNLFTVADLSTVWVELSLFPRDLGKVKLGQRVHVKNVDAGLAADGTLIYVAPFGSSTNQTLTARVLIDNPDRSWKPGLYVTADVVLGQWPAALAVRSEAIQELEGRSVVFVEHTAGIFEPRPVKLGRSDDQFSEVTDGMGAQDRYVAKGSFILKSQLGAGAAEHGH